MINTRAALRRNFVMIVLLLTMAAISGFPAERDALSDACPAGSLRVPPVPEWADASQPVC
jgi:hypothetical protein